MACRWGPVSTTLCRLTRARGVVAFDRLEAATGSFLALQPLNRVVRVLRRDEPWKVEA